MKYFLTGLLFLMACGGATTPAALTLDGTWTESSPAAFATFCTAHSFTGCSNVLQISGNGGTYSYVNSACAVNVGRYFPLQLSRDDTKGSMTLQTETIVNTNCDAFPSSDFPQNISWQGAYTISGTTLTITEANGTAHTFTRN